MQMPFAPNVSILVSTYDTSHDVDQLLANITLRIKTRWSIFLADAGSSSAWKTR